MNYTTKSTPDTKELVRSQLPALKQLVKMGYRYLSPVEVMEMRGHKTSGVLLEGVLLEWLSANNHIVQRGDRYDFEEGKLREAVRLLKNFSTTEGYMKANAFVYDMLTMGVDISQTIEGDSKDRPLKYIDWDCWENNVFHVTEEYSVMRDGMDETYRPDIVVFVNGIPLVVIECKRPGGTGAKSPITLGIEQHIRNQQRDGIRSLYYYSQLLFSLSGTEGKYGTSGTPEEFWSVWKEVFLSVEEKQAYYQKLDALLSQPLELQEERAIYAQREYLKEDSGTASGQERLLYRLMQPKVLLDFIRNYTLFDKGVKKVARYQQYAVIGEAMLRIEQLDRNGQRQGGVVWHTQGSGKSLTMVMLAQLIARSSDLIPRAKIILVTDRVDLDKQITDTFKHCGIDTIRATSGIHLATLVKEKKKVVITTIVDKFENAVRNTKPDPSEDVIVMIDEAHRSQYGGRFVEMQRLFPNACFLAFTGTPLMKEEKTKNKFGSYIGKPYTMEAAVEDGAVVPLVYEGRMVPVMANDKAFEAQVERVIGDLDEEVQVVLRNKVMTLNRLKATDSMLREIAMDISDHYVKNIQTSNPQGKAKAQLVAPTIATALKYKRYIEEYRKVTCAVVVSETDNREGAQSVLSEGDLKAEEKAFFKWVKDEFGNMKNYTERITDNFKNGNKPEILIVVAKLLTGFDAPCDTALYLCRSLKEHTLLQAAARVNRLFPGKDYGFIVDYWGNLKNWQEAKEMYTDLGDLEKEDLERMEGTLTPVNDLVRDLPERHDELLRLFAQRGAKDRDYNSYSELLAEETLREKFYDALLAFSKLLKVCMASVYFVNNTPAEEIERYKKDLKFFVVLRNDVRFRYGDEHDYSSYEYQLEQLMNQYVLPEGTTIQLTKRVNLHDDEAYMKAYEARYGKAGKADVIASKIKKNISIRMDEDAAYYKNIGEQLKELVALYRADRIGELDYLDQVEQLESEVREKEAGMERADNGVPSSVREHPSVFPFFRLSEENWNDIQDRDGFHAALALKTEEVVFEKIYFDDQVRVDWVGNIDIENAFKQQLEDVVFDLLEPYEGKRVDWNRIDDYIREVLRNVKANHQ
ncbi:HsdR family type I site-specific deoxyribonuclease [Halosquirtibacter xylanolyticus]|uniref:type I restriction endonuclease subunit R n=1 Tax=Halosquirtibacter xylanolyticus TaxID=3374599 RepID=UPI00374A5FF7|nr:HsdR family type I site-specific deoxyribonuclease [Prolixibacteraceae bacterium]